MLVGEIWSSYLDFPNPDSMEVYIAVMIVRTSDDLIDSLVLESSSGSIFKPGYMLQLKTYDFKEIGFKQDV